MPPGSLGSDRRRLAILDRLRRRYALFEDQIIVGGQSFAFTRVADPKVVLDSVIRDESAGKPARMPYWAELWESAPAVGEWLVANAVDRLSTLDLGCGMGFAGMVAASLGLPVLFADLEPEALLFAELNAWPWRSRCRFRRLDWQRDQLDERFDLILGADVLYEQGQREHLEPFWRQHLLPGGRVILGEPGRRSGDDFLPWIAERGWRVALCRVHLAAFGKTVRVIELTRDEHAQTRPSG